MRPTELATVASDQSVQCQVCQWRCEVAPGETGRCLVRRNEEGVLLALNDSLISAATIGPVEDHGFLHFFPDSLAFALGSWGTPTPREQDADHYALLPGEDAPRRSLEAERAVRFAQERLCRGMIWTYSDPAVAFEFLLDGLKIARAASRYTAVVTSGYWTPEALDLLGPYLDGINLRCFGFSDASYATLTGFAQWTGIFEQLERAFKQHICHIEITLVLHPGVNDGAEELRALAGWVKEHLRPAIPLHVVPIADAPAGAATQARELLRQEGLQFVYGPDHMEKTQCPSCGWPVIERAEKQSRLLGVHSGLCDNCGADLYLRTSIFKHRG